MVGAPVHIGGFEHGFVEVMDRGGDKPVLRTSTIACGHCGKHHVIRHGSGRWRVLGFCALCNRMVCGPTCTGNCVPQEAQVENIEAGRDVDAPRPELTGWTPAVERSLILPKINS